MIRRAPGRFRDVLQEALGLHRTLILAHRGDSFHAPENTLEAASLGLKSGADAWEFDVQLSRDDVPILLHDQSLLRTTNVAQVFNDDPRADLGYLVEEFDLHEIRQLDAGHWYVSEEARPRSARAFGTLERLDQEDLTRWSTFGVKIPTLAEALDFTREADWLANVELKSRHNGDFKLLDTVLQAIRTAAVDDRILVSSFDHAEIARAKAIVPRIATGVLVTTPLHQPANYVRRSVGADAYHIAAAAIGTESAAYLRRLPGGRLRLEDIESCRAAGVPVLVYTVNRAGLNETADHLAGAGVAGLFTDDPCSLAARFIPS